MSGFKIFSPLTVIFPFFINSLTCVREPIPNVVKYLSSRTKNTSLVFGCLFYILKVPDLKVDFLLKVRP